MVCFQFDMRHQQLSKEEKVDALIVPFHEHVIPCRRPKRYSSFPYLGRYPMAPGGNCSYRYDGIRHLYCLLSFEGLLTNFRGIRTHWDKQNTVQTTHIKLSYK